MKVTECLETWKEDADDFSFDHFAIILTDGTELFKAQYSKELAIHHDIDITELDCPLYRISTKDIWPPLKNDLTLAPQPVSDEFYQGTRVLADYNPQTSSVKPCDLLLHEAQICEILRQNPHKNIVSYLGVTCDEGLIKSLCFVKYEETLADRLNDPNRPLNVPKCLNGVKDGLDHLHSLGLKHNDLNYRNIMLDKQDVPVIIDFDSCECEGNIPLCMGTPGWTDGAYITRSERKNDDFGWNKLRHTLLVSYNARWRWESVGYRMRKSLILKSPMRFKSTLVESKDWCLIAYVLLI